MTATNDKNTAIYLSSDTRIDTTEDMTRRLFKVAELLAKVNNPREDSQITQAQPKELTQED